MGTLAKRLGQLAARSLETESANILKTSAENKIPGSLALALDGTLRRGHDMKTFGLGTAASIADVHRYGRFTRSMHAIYSTMEVELDKSVGRSTPVSFVWERHGDLLRREAKLRADLADVNLEPISNPSGPTLSYVQLIRSAGSADRADAGSARLLGHLYCRYFADLFGGQMLRAPTAAALNLPSGTPRHYVFDLKDTSRRKAINGIYASLNEAGEMLPETSREAVVAEAMSAFKSNIDVYAEEPLWGDAIKGVFNVATGMAKIQVLGNK